MPLARASLAAPLDAESEEVERFAHVRDPGLGLRDAQAQQREHDHGRNGKHTGEPRRGTTEPFHAERGPGCSIRCRQNDIRPEPAAVISCARIALGPFAAHGVASTSFEVRVSRKAPRIPR